VISILYQKKNVKNIIFVTIIFGGLNVFMPITSIQIPNNLSLARKNYKNKNKIKDIIRNKITRNANISLIQDWKYKDAKQKHGICFKKIQIKLY
jgi:hypothetical protein